uniref:Secreted protein n=1 Tax=Chromera velia CCMP2878 TaxID=1169474 RepID=A0A0G4HIA6_9ALVE|eukprot:Cvel_27867.t1-p1 / transcript=Cvel_27867.t1 / gene=Cvel_27867 / organism=Chromera_velia_CCMP2878 / gene_product=hypothetical protein / transcript_product=hypothetical protein / location=Cvel_scaffold3547:550-969(-) / protein_length=140 / sequence_SO=supercontig / SO=protein_coding / is_pseudo=false
MNFAVSFFVALFCLVFLAEGQGDVVPNSISKLEIEFTNGALPPPFFKKTRITLENGVITKEANVPLKVANTAGDNIRHIPNSGAASSSKQKSLRGGPRYDMRVTGEDGEVVTGGADTFGQQALQHVASVMDQLFHAPTAQ